MRRRLEQLLPLLAVVGFIAAALLLNLLLTNAQDRGVDALEDSVEAEVQAIARSQDQRFDNTLSSL
jgi:hypothetical protein